MRVPQNPSRRRLYQPFLEVIEDRLSPGSWALLGPNLLQAGDPLVGDTFRELLGQADSQNGSLTASRADLTGMRGNALDERALTSQGAATASVHQEPQLISAFDVGVALNALNFIAPHGPADSLQGSVKTPPCIGTIPEDPPKGFFDPVPVADVEVRLDDGQFQTTTDKQGFYAFGVLPEGKHTVGFFVANYGEARATVLIQQGGEFNLDVLLPFGTTANPGQFEVRFHQGVPQEEIDALNKSYGVTVLEAFQNDYRLQIPERMYTQDFITAYRRELIVESAEHFVVFCA
jgi:hypothetical protein